MSGYPRRSRLGLIEAVVGKLLIVLLVQYPRRSRLGLIEAQGDTAFRIAVDPGIRGVRASASLKRSEKGCPKTTTRWYPRRSRLGLIEASCAPYGVSRQLLVSEAFAPRPH